MFMEFDADKIVEFAIQYGVKFATAVFIFVVGKWVAKIIVNIAKSAMAKSKVDDTLISFIGNIVYGLILAFVIIAALSQIGIQTASLAAILAAAGLAVGLALQGSLSNFAAGVMIILFRPFKIGDTVEAGGATGKVHDIDIFTTTLTSDDGKKIIVPNAAITSGKIVVFP